MKQKPDVGDIITCGYRLDGDVLIYREFNQKMFTFPISSMVKIPTGSTALVLEIHTRFDGYVAKILVSNETADIGWIHSNRIIGVN